MLTQIQTQQTELETRIITYDQCLSTIRQDMFEIKMKITNLLEIYPTNPILLELQKKLSEAERKQIVLKTMLEELKKLLTEKQYMTVATRSLTFYLTLEMQFCDVNNIKTKLFEYEKQTQKSFICCLI